MSVTYPKKLNSLKNRLHLVVIHRRNEREQNSSNVDGDLELHKSVTHPTSRLKTYL
jgi:septum formation topological specificity factor MinE